MSRLLFRVLFVLVVVAVFAALMIFDTTALIRLGIYCVSGGCGVNPLWIAGAAIVLGLALIFWPRAPLPKPKAGPRPKPIAARKKAAAKPSTTKETPRKKPAPRKQPGGKRRRAD